MPPIPPDSPPPSTHPVPLPGSRAATRTADSVVPLGSPAAAPSAGAVATPARRDKVEMFIDGTNFYRSLETAGHRYDIDIPQFARRMAGLKGDYMFVKAYYCTAPFMYRHTEAFRRQQRLFELLRRSRSVELVLGHHERTAEGKYEEKETDANVIVSMLTGAYEDRYDVALLVSADTDMKPAVKAVQQLQKRVIWVHFPHQAHSELATLCDGTHPLHDTFLRTCRVVVPQHQRRQWPRR